MVDQQTYGSFPLFSPQPLAQAQTFLSLGSVAGRSVAGLPVAQLPDARGLLPLAVAGLRLLRLEVDPIDILPGLPATRILICSEPADLFLADPVLGHGGHELVATSSSDASRT